MRQAGLAISPAVTNRQPAPPSGGRHRLADAHQRNESKQDEGSHENTDSTGTAEDLRLTALMLPLPVRRATDLREVFRVLIALASLARAAAHAETLSSALPGGGEYCILAYRD